mgnify:CR=1 FL=1
MHLGLVTYMWGAEWDLPTIIKNCEAAGWTGVELRTTHKHGVEIPLSEQQRKDVAKRFADSMAVRVLVSIVKLGFAWGLALRMNLPDSITLEQMPLYKVCPLREKVFF